MSNKKEKPRKKWKWLIVIVVLIIVLFAVVKIVFINNDDKGSDNNSRTDIESEETADNADAIDDDSEESRQQVFETIVYDKANAFRDITVKKIKGTTVYFDWKTKKGKTELFIRFDTEPGNIGWSAGWSPTDAYGAGPKDFANSVCDELDAMD